MQSGTKRLAFILSALLIVSAFAASVTTYDQILANSFNKVSITNPGTSATLTIAAGKSLTANNSLTLAGTDSTTMTFPTTSGTVPAFSSVAQGDLVYALTSTSFSRLAKSTSSTRYLANTGTSNAPAWSQIDLSNGVASLLPIANGGTNASSASSARTNLGFIHILKTSDTARTSTTSPAADPTLQFSVTNGEQWGFEIDAYVQVASATPGLKGGMTMPSVSVSRWSNLLTLNNGITGGNTGLSGTNLGVDFGALPVTSPAVYLWKLWGTLQASGTGTVSIDWSQSVSSGSATTVMAGSSLRAWKIN